MIVFVNTDFILSSLSLFLPFGPPDEPELESPLPLERLTELSSFSLVFFGFDELEQKFKCACRILLELTPSDLDSSLTMALYSFWRIFNYKTIISEYLKQNELEIYVCIYLPVFYLKKLNIDLIYID